MYFFDEETFKDYIKFAMNFSSTKLEVKNLEGKWIYNIEFNYKKGVTKNIFT
jgi:hypothetical protein